MVVVLVEVGGGGASSRWCRRVRWSPGRRHRARRRRCSRRRASTTATSTTPTAEPAAAGCASAHDGRSSAAGGGNVPAGTLTIVLTVLSSSSGIASHRDRRSCVSSDRQTNRKDPAMNASTPTLEPTPDQPNRRFRRAPRRSVSPPACSAVVRSACWSPCRRSRAPRPTPSPCRTAATPAATPAPSRSTDDDATDTARPDAGAPHPRGAPVAGRRRHDHRRAGRCGRRPPRRAACPGAVGTRRHGRSRPRWPRLRRHGRRRCARHHRRRARARRCRAASRSPTWPRPRASTCRS